MTTRREIKAKILVWLMRKWNFVIFAFREGAPWENFGVVKCEDLGENNEGSRSIEDVLSLLIERCMEQRDERAKRIILDAAERYLSRYEIDCKNFVKKVYNKN